MTAVATEPRGFMSRFKRTGDPVLINGKPIPHRAAQQAAHSIIWGTLLGFVAAGFYFGVWEVNWYIHIGPVYAHLFWLKNWWDNTLGMWLAHHTGGFITAANYPNYRHSVGRNLAEPAAVILAVLALTAPAKYWDRKLTTLGTTVRLALGFVAYLLLAAAGTWLIYTNQSHGWWNPGGLSHALLLVAQFFILGFIIGRVLHLILGPVGARLQGKGVEIACDHYSRKHRDGVPWWISRNILVPSVRERGQLLLDADRASDEALHLFLRWAQTPWWRKTLTSLLWWAVVAVLVFLIGMAFLGFIGHIWVGVLGHSFPYLAP